MKKYEGRKTERRQPIQGQGSGNFSISFIPESYIRFSSLICPLDSFFLCTILEMCQ